MTENEFNKVLRVAKILRDKALSQGYARVYLDEVMDEITLTTGIDVDTIRLALRPLRSWPHEQNPFILKVITRGPYIESGEIGDVRLNMAVAAHCLPGELDYRPGTDPVTPADLDRLKSTVIG